ncbi:hypothetical protein ABIE18_003885, partial [Arthrobacter sp. 2762]
EKISRFYTPSETNESNCSCASWPAVLTLV